MPLCGSYQSAQRLNWMRTSKCSKIHFVTMFSKCGKLLMMLMIDSNYTFGNSVF